MKIELEQCHPVVVQTNSQVALPQLLETFPGVQLVECAKSKQIKLNEITIQRHCFISKSGHFPCGNNLCNYLNTVICICMRLQPHILPVDTGDGWDILAGKGKRNGGIEV